MSFPNFNINHRQVHLCLLSTTMKGLAFFICISSKGGKLFYGLFFDSNIINFTRAPFLSATFFPLSFLQTLQLHWHFTTKKVCVFIPSLPFFLPYRLPLERGRLPFVFSSSALVLHSLPSLFVGESDVFHHNDQSLFD